MADFDSEMFNVGNERARQPRGGGNSQRAPRSTESHGERNDTKAVSYVETEYFADRDALKNRILQ